MSTNVGSVVSHFPKPQNGFVTTLASTISSGATTVPLNSVSGYTNGQIAVFVVDPTDVTKKQTFTGVIDTSGVQVTSVIWTAGTNQSHSGGATVVDYVTATHLGMVSKGILVEHDQDGTHGNITGGNATMTGTVTADVVGVTTTLNSNGTLNIAGATTAGWDGWITHSTTWTYVSATTFKVTGVDVTTVFPVGTKIRLTQTTVKYFYVTAATFSTDTTITVTGGSDYSLVNAAITVTGYSYSDTPRGFPSAFNYTPTFANTTLGNGTVAGRFSMRGRYVKFRATFTLGGTSAVASNPTVSYPVTAATITQNMPIGVTNSQDTGSASTMGLLLYSSTTVGLPTCGVASGAYTQLSGLTSLVPFTWGSTDALWVDADYEAA